MRGVSIWLIVFSLFSFRAYAGEAGDCEVRQALDEMTRRLVSTHLEMEVDDEVVLKYMELLRPDGSFPDLDYATVHGGAYFPVGSHLKRLVAMAVAYRKPESRHYDSKRLLDKVMAGIDYWYAVRPVSGNWWFNDIGAPQDYMVPLLLLKDKMDEKKRLHYSSYLRDLTGNKGHKGKNRTWVAHITIHKGCIENDLELVKTGFASIASTIKIVSRQGDEGIKIDGSFHQHRPQLYSGGYGLSYVDDIAYCLQLVEGTVFESYFTQEKKDIFSNLMLKGHRWLGYRSAFDFGAVGRNISRPAGTGNISARTLARMEKNDALHAADYSAWKEHLSGGISPVSGNRYFWKSDIMVHRGSGYYLSAKTISTRTNGTEMLNDENLKGYNLPLGATNIMTSGMEYKQIFPVWNWNRIPGTTAIQQPDSARLDGYLFGQNEFGGGVSSGKHGMVAYEHTYKGVKARKAYFFLEDALLCLGAGIASDSREEVTTTVNQCFYKGCMEAGADGWSRTYKEGGAVRNPAWVYHDRVGYLFPAGGEIVAERKRQTGSWRTINKSGSDKEVSADIFNLVISHGRGPVDGQYAYLVVPDVEPDEFRDFVSAHAYHIVKNTPDVQAVRLRHRYAAVFYVPGSLELEEGLTLAVDKPVMVYMERVAGKFQLWVSDPLFSQKRVCVSLNGRREEIDFPDGDFTGSAAFVEMADVQPYGLQCEYLDNPLGIDVSQPRLSWKMGNILLLRGKKQTAYQVLVSSSQALLEKNQGDLWDSGTVRSSESVNIVYGGSKPLLAGQKCFWKVRVADEQEVWSAWSTVASWRMGLFSADWTAQWMGSAEMESQSVGGRKIDNRMADPWLRKAFVLQDAPQDAVIYVASVGYHELYVNGVKVGDAVLAPSVTDHKSRARYMTYDITPHLKPGKNAVALWLGTSWAVFPAYQREDKPAIPMALVQAEIQLQSGETVRVVSDDSWKVHASPNRLIGYWEAHHFGGECYDASLEIEGWNTAGFDDSAWETAKTYHPKLKVSADRTESNRLMEEIKPRIVQEISPGVYRIDMGVNYAGWFEMQLQGEPGDSILFQFSERENEKCSYGIHSIYKIGNKRKGVFCNRFNYMTGRWVWITGLREKPQLDQIRGWMIRPDYHRSGGFECDISLLNDIYRTTLWTFENLSLGNYVVDCPHRERCGYGGDALATTRTALGNYQLGAFYTKWMEDWRDVQDDKGNVPYTAPTRIGGGGPSWSGFCITLPWEFYRQYGDVRMLAESFLTIQRWLDFVETKSENDMLVRWGGKWSFLGDWLWPNAWPERSAMEKQGKALGDTRETLFFNNCHWIYSLETAAQIAGVLGRDSVAAAYRQRAAQIRRAVHAAFFNKKDNSYVNGFPAYLAMALLVDLPPKSLKPKVWKRLEQEILVNRKGHFWGGITAGSFLMHTLLDSGRSDLIFEMAVKEDFPGWGNMLKQGLGTFFEDWECRGSALHSSYLYIGSWFIEALGGIKRPEGGGRQFVIEPWIAPNGPKQVLSHYHSIYGDVVSNWCVSGGMLHLEISVPDNTTSLLKLSGIHPDSIKEGGNALQEAQGVSLHVRKKNAVSLLLQSGTYHISLPIPCKAE